MSTQSRNLDWVFSFWAFLAVGLGAFFLLEEAATAAYIVAALLAFCPRSVGVVFRLALFASPLLLGLLGPPVLLVIIPLALAFSGLVREALIAAVSLSMLVFGQPYLQALPDHSILTIPIVSMYFVALPILVNNLVFLRSITLSTHIFSLISTLLVILILDAAASELMTVSDFTQIPLRMFAVLLPLLGTAWLTKKLLQDYLPKRTRIIAFTAVALGVLVSLSIPKSPVSQIVFDEAHGEWETVKADFLPESFGRGSNYTYSQLYAAVQKVKDATTFDSEKMDLPPIDSIFVLKMPTSPLSEQFNLKLSDWVGKGGRLLVVADHTDLYDSTQILNAFLKPAFNLEINSDAVFDRVGMPNYVEGNWSGMLTARIDSFTHSMHWLTGASLESMPMNLVELTSFGLSFSEPADYARAHRFGLFQPAFENRFLKHSSSVAFSHGRGAVALVLDSTPWSNFAIFREPYLELFFNLIHVLERPKSLAIVGTAWLVFLFLAVLLAVFRNKVVIYISSFSMALFFVSSLQLAWPTTSMSALEKVVQLKVVVGQGTSLEFLNQLIPPGQRNFSRIISSMGKYDLMPLSYVPGESPGPLALGKRWLFIEPDEQQLPHPAEIVKFLREGRNVVIAFAPEQASKPYVVDWLAGLGLTTQRHTSVSLSATTQSQGSGSIANRGVSLDREIRVTTRPFAHSILADYESDKYFQTYTARPTKLPRLSGLLSVGFASDQFSDDAVGDVWEGTRPSSIGALREKQLASIVLGIERPDAYPPNLYFPSFQKPLIEELDAQLDKFLIAEGGKTILSGQLSVATRGDKTVNTLKALRDQVFRFVVEYCPAINTITECKSRFLSENMLEWLVSWKSDGSGGIEAIELVHEVRMSSIGKNMNIVFARQ